ncbi:TPA: filamentous hemagglutinin N-terminal domain-containing protein, partial [Campylobacter coli]|nr:filamentous hemagglutinin N-terminal domain-containing protein [Campylobacter coli]
THKISNHIMLSGITVSLLFSPSMALPSGGKFTHGTSGSININGNNMNIMGDGTNSVIQWGGGFNIGKSEQVNFNGSNKNYLNIAHGANKSTIEGVLNASGNNVFLINPNGVIITKTGTINANRFVASTASMSDADMKNFANGNLDYNTFSPVFKPNSGNVVNLGGEITAQSVTFQGNKVLSNAYSDFDQDTENHPKKISASEINLQGNEIYVDVSSINATALNKINIKGSENNNFKGSMYLNAMGYYYNPYSYLVFDKYTDSNSNNNFKVYKYVGIGSDLDWWHFAKGWNENKEGFRSTAEEYRLTNDIDFKGDKGQNYASYCIDKLGCASMIVGYGTTFKDVSFNGQGFTLKNINTIVEVNDERKQYDAGIFGRVNNATIKNVNVDYKGGGVKVDFISNRYLTYIGGFIGKIENSLVENISLKNIKEITANNTFGVGGFAGTSEGNVNFKNILLDGGNIMSINSIRSSAGGFISSASEGDNFENVYVHNINSIKSDSNNAGGFIGSISSSSYNWKIPVSFNKIYISNINSIESALYAGGFIGSAYGVKAENIKIENIKKISSRNSAGGFAGKVSPGEYNGISINNIGTIKSTKSGGFAGAMDTGSNENKKNATIKNVHIYDIERIEAVGYTKNTYSGGLIGEISSINAPTGESTNNTFENITIDKIGNFYTEGDLGFTYTGGLIGTIANNFNANYNFSNINLFFDSSMRVAGINYKVGKIVGKSTSSKLSFKNSNLYYIFNNFEGSRSESYSGLNLDQYVNSNEQTKYEDFLKKDVTVKPVVDSYQSNNIISPELPDIEKIKNEIAILDKEDLLEDVIQKEIIEDITKKYYFVDIKTLNDLLLVYSQLNSKSSKEERINFVQNHLLVSKNEQEAKEVVESLDFLLAYKTNGLENAEKNGILKDEEAKNTNRIIQDKVKKTLSYEQDLIVNFLQNEKTGLKWLVDYTNARLQELKNLQENLKEAVLNYNAYVDLINANKVEKDELKLEVLRQNIDKLTTESERLSIEIDEKQNILSKWQDKSKTDSNEHFVILGKFNYDPLIKPVLNELNTDSGDGVKDPDLKPDPELPEDNLKFEQIAALNLIKQEEEEEKEIGETDGRIRSITCIVSDNFKSMNPCVVEGI